MRCVIFFAAAVAIVAVVFSFLDENRKYEVKSVILGPMFRIGWSTGILPKMMFVSYDDSGYRHSRGFTKEHFQKVRAFQASKDDAFVVTFPKAGTHLTGQLVLQVLAKGTLDFESIHHVITVLEFGNIRPELCGDEKLLTIDNYKDQMSTRPVVHITHIPVFHVPMHPDAKYVVMMRNPIDSLLSLHTMIKKKLGTLAPRINELFYFMFRGDPIAPGGYGWAEYNLDWWKKRNDGNVLFLFYEDAIRNLTNTVVDVTKFFGQDIDWEIIEKVRYLASLDYMKPNKLKFEPPSGCQAPFPIEKPGKFDMVNKGKSQKDKKRVPLNIRMEMKDYYLRVFADTDFPIDRYIGAFSDDGETG